jgi:hypothetical protein
MIRANTYGRMSVTFTIAPTYAIQRDAQTSGPCGADWQQGAASAAALSGHSGTHMVFIAGEATCNAGAHAARYSTSAYINSLVNAQTIAHEIFHCLGLGHAHSMRCNTNVALGTCTATEYGGAYSTQGGGNGPLSPNEIDALGIAPPPTFLDRLPSQIRHLEPLETTPVFDVVRTNANALVTYIEYHGGLWLGVPHAPAIVIRESFSDTSSIASLAIGEVFEDVIGGVRVTNLGGGGYKLETWTPTTVPILTPATPNNTGGYGYLPPNCFYTICKTNTPTPTRTQPAPTATATPRPTSVPPSATSTAQATGTPTSVPTGTPTPLPAIISTPTPTATFPTSPGPAGSTVAALGLFGAIAFWLTKKFQWLKSKFRKK